MNEHLTNTEKIQLGHEAFKEFLKPFEPIDNFTEKFLVIIIEMLYNSSKEINSWQSKQN